MECEKDHLSRTLDSNYNRQYFSDKAQILTCQKARESWCLLETEISVSSRESKVGKGGS